VTQSSDPISTYVEALDRQRQERPEVDAELEAAALAELQGVGAMAWPVEGGEWLLRADRDEEGAFISASFQPESA
jgi:hypothetical protein